MAATTTRLENILLLSREERVRQRAYELYLQRDAQNGSPTEDWARAEADIQAEDDATVDEASQESFPASDPPAR